MTNCQFCGKSYAVQFTVWIDRKFNMDSKGHKEYDLDLELCQYHAELAVEGLFTDQAFLRLFINSTRRMKHARHGF